MATGKVNPFPDERPIPSVKVAIQTKVSDNKRVQAAFNKFIAYTLKEKQVNKLTYDKISIKKKMSVESIDDLILRTKDLVDIAILESIREDYVDYPVDIKMFIAAIY